MKQRQVKTRQAKRRRQEVPALQFKALGHRVKTPTRHLETFKAPKKLDLVIMKAINFTSLCPITGQPDYGQIVIEYIPDELCLESKSLKLYLMTFRNEGAFAEQLSETIALDVLHALQALKVKVTFIQDARGDIEITASSTVRRGEA